MANFFGIIVLVFIVDYYVIKICLFCIRRISGSSSLWNINPLSLLFYKEFIVFSLVGSSLFLMGFGKDYYQYALVSNKKLQWLVWLSIIYGSLMFFIFLYILNNTFSNHPFKNITEKTSKLCTLHNERMSYYVITLLILISLVYFVLYCRRCGYVPIVSMFSLDSTFLSSLRFNDKFLSTENSLIKNLLLITLPPISSYASYLGYNCKKNYKWKFLFILSVINAIFCLTFRFEKSFLIYYLLGFMFLPRNKNKIDKKTFNKNNKKKTLFLLLIVIMGFIYVLYVTDKSNFTWTNFFRPIYRVIYSQVVGMYQHYKIFPSEISYLDFKHFPTTIAKLFNCEEIRSARLVMLETSSNATSGNMNTFFLGEAFANGGIFSVIIAPFVVALSVYIEFMFYNLLTDSIFSRSCIIFVFVNCVPITGGYLDFFYNPTSIIVFILGILFNYIILGHA